MALIFQIDPATGNLQAYHDGELIGIIGAETIASGSTVKTVWRFIPTEGKPGPMLETIKAVQNVLFDHYNTPIAPL